MKRNNSIKYLPEFDKKVDLNSMKTHLRIMENNPCKWETKENVIMRKK